jgi:S1-C subfamily serine protease
VTPDGPAAKAGIQKGDVITGIGGAKTDSLKEAAKKLASRPEGDSLEFAVRRGDAEPMPVVVNLGSGL